MPQPSREQTPFILCHTHQTFTSKQVEPKRRWKSKMKIAIIYHHRYDLFYLTMTEYLLDDEVKLPVPSSSRFHSRSTIAKNSHHSQDHDKKFQLRPRAKSEAVLDVMSSSHKLSQSNPIVDNMRILSSTIHGSLNLHTILE